MAGIQPLPGGGNPWAQALPGFVQQLAMMKVRQNFIAKEAEMKREYDKVKLEEERVYQEGILKQKQEFTGSENQKKSDAAMARKRLTKPSSMIEQYNFAVKQSVTGEGPPPGSFTEWRTKQKQAGATRISMGEKVQLHAAKQEETRKGLVKSPGFATKAIQSLKIKHGENWDMMEPYQQQELQFKEMTSQIKSVYPDAVFDERNGKEGWWVGNKLIRLWTDPTREYFNKHGKR